MPEETAQLSYLLNPKKVKLSPVSLHVSLSCVGLTGKPPAWDFSHMPKQLTLVRADEKGRILIRGTRKGQQYLVTADQGGWWVKPAPQVKTPTPETEALVAETWTQLGPAPEIDHAEL